MTDTPKPIFSAILFIFQVLKLHGSDEISDGSGGSSATHVSKRKSKGEEDNDFEDQLSVKKKQGPKKIKGE